MGVGMPQGIYLNEFGLVLRAAFDDDSHVGIYHVGSSLTQKRGWRDVDVRVMLEADRYEAMGFGNPHLPQHNAKWVAYAMAFSALGEKMTGLPIDFQIQEINHANKFDDGPRSALGIMPLATLRQENEDQRNCNTNHGE